MSGLLYSMMNDDDDDDDGVGDDDDDVGDGVRTLITVIVSVLR